MSAARPAPAPPGGTLLELVLEEQATLDAPSAVERFSARHDAGDVPAGRSFYEDLLPAHGPGPGEQYAFRVDLDACTGCKACVTACHSLNGLDPGETWRSVGTLVGAEDGRAVARTVTTACHHCEDPACLSGCPVVAYEKDPVTGIVRHLDDQCIGCQYCTLTCPYDVPQYSERLGIVRKCDMCTGRLEAGEAPACVQGCPNGAIAIDVVPVRGEAGAGDPLLPAEAGALAPASLTRPSTRYVAGGAVARPARATTAASAADPRRPRLADAALRPADAGALVPGPRHWPLVWLLVGTQLSVGLLGAALLAHAAGGPLSPAWLGLAWLAAAAGQAASLTHLGRPLQAWRAVLGLRTSWMSREICALGLYLLVLSCCLVAATGVLPAWAGAAGGGAAVLGAAAWGAGAVGVAASVMIYAVTGRPAWSLARTALRFGGGTVLLGASTAVAVALLGSGGHAGAPALVATAHSLGAIVTVSAAERGWHATDRSSPLAALARGARLLDGPLRGRVVLRTSLLAAGAGLLAASAAFAAAGVGGWLAAATALAGAVSCVAAEVAGRHLFFVAEAARGMPGG